MYVVPMERAYHIKNSKSPEINLQCLKNKLMQGCKFIILQMYYSGEIIELLLIVQCIWK